MQPNAKQQAHSHLCQSFATYNFLFHSNANKLSGALVTGQFKENSKKIAKMLLLAFKGQDKKVDIILKNLDKGGSAKKLKEILEELKNTGIE